MNYSDKIAKLSEKIKEADTIVIGAGAGLSTAAGFVYSGARFEEYFSDFKEKYGFSDMYSGGFCNYKTLEEYWGYWCRYIYINRYMAPPTSLYEDLYRLIMLMYGKEANNRKQDIDRQHHTIPNQRS